MMWAHVLILCCLIVAGIALIFCLAEKKPRNRFKRGVLPPPSSKCNRRNVEAVTR